LGHTYAVRRVKCSPFHEPLVASCSYDMSVRVWDFHAPENAVVQRCEQHSEFVIGLDWSTLVEGLLASTGWDQMVYAWQQGMDPRA